MENDFRVKKINAKEQVQFHLTRLRHSWWPKSEENYIDITSDSDNDKDELEIL